MLLTTIDDNKHFDFIFYISFRSVEIVFWMIVKKVNLKTTYKEEFVSNLFWFIYVEFCWLVFYFSILR